MAGKTQPVKLKGKKLYRGDTEVASIGLRSGYHVKVGEEIVAEGFAYFRDAVKWARDTIDRGDFDRCTCRPVVTVAGHTYCGGMDACPVHGFGPSKPT